MRTRYEIEESDAYLGARDLLLRRGKAWAGTNGLVMSLLLAGALLDSRHFSSDGRLGYWSMEEPVPVARLAESVWDTVRAHFDVDSLSPITQLGLRGRVDNDLEHIFDAFEALGAVTSIPDLASEVFSEDLDEGVAMPSGAVRTFHR